MYTCVYVCVCVCVCVWCGGVRVNLAISKYHLLPTSLRASPLLVRFGAAAETVLQWQATDIQGLLHSARLNAHTRLASNETLAHVRCKIVCVCVRARVRVCACVCARV
jgi:hypothetical protein